MSDDAVVPGSGDPAATGGEGTTPSATPPGGPPVGGEDEGDLVDLSQVAEDFDASELAKLGQTPPARGEGKDRGEGKTGATPDARLREFIDKNYGGDVEAFIHAQYASREEGKRLRERLTELEEAVRTPREPDKPVDEAAVFKEARAQSAEIQALDQEVQVIDNQLKDCQTTGAQIAARAAQIGTELKTIQKDLAKAEPDDRIQLLNAQTELKAELMGLDHDWKLNETEARRLGTGRRQIQREILRAESSIRDQMAYERDQSRDHDADVQMTREQFDASLAYFFKELGIDATSDQGKYIRDSTRSQLRDHLASLGDGIGLDRHQIHGAVGSLVERAAKSFGITKKVTPSKTPTPRPVVVPRTITAPSIRSSPSSQTSLDGVLDNPELSPKQKADFVRKRANTVFAAASRVRREGGPLS